MEEYEQQKLPFPGQGEPTALDSLLEQYAQAESTYKSLRNATRESTATAPPNNYGITRSQARLIDKPLYLSQEEATSLEGQVELITSRRSKPAARATDLAQRIESIAHQDAKLARKQVIRINSAFHQYLEAGTFDNIEQNYQEQANNLVQEAPKYLPQASQKEKETLKKTLSTIDRSVLDEKSQSTYKQLEEQLYEQPDPELARENIEQLRRLLDE